MPQRWYYRRDRADLPLTSRELQVLEWYSRGLRTMMVAQAMGVSPETVKTTIAHARAKLRAKNTAHAVGNAIRLGLIK